MELAIATQIPVAAWRDEDDATIATALDVLHQQNESIKKNRSRRRGR